MEVEDRDHMPTRHRCLSRSPAVASDSISLSSVDNFDNDEEIEFRPRTHRLDTLTSQSSAHSCMARLHALHNVQSDDSALSVASSPCEDADKYLESPMNASSATHSPSSATQSHYGSSGSLADTPSAQSPVGEEERRPPPLDSPSGRNLKSKSEYNSSFLGLAFQCGGSNHSLSQLDRPASTLFFQRGLQTCSTVSEPDLLRIKCSQSCSSSTSDGSPKQRTRKDTNSARIGMKAVGGFFRSIMIPKKQKPHRRIDTCQSTPDARIAAQVNSNASRVTVQQVLKWQQSLVDCLNDYAGCEAFTQFVESEHSGENVMFWKAVQRYRNCPGKHQATRICSEHIHDHAEYQVNIEYRTRKDIEEHLDEDDPDGLLFEKAMKHIMDLMSRDTYRRFLASPQFQLVKSQVYLDGRIALTR